MNDPGKAADRRDLDPGRGNVALHRFAILTAGATFCLIFVGGLVTSTGSALAVPDWPLSFGKFFPKLEGGVLYEHGHRLFAGAVTILTLALMVWMLGRERRSWVRNLAVAAFGLILVQALLGGLTVLLRLPLPIAVAHAATAQAFFCITVALALFSNPTWDGLARIKGPQLRPSIAPLACATTAAIYVQIVIGAVMRHMGAGLAIPDFPLAFGQLIPRLEYAPQIVNFAHRVGALVVFALIAPTVTRVVRFYGDQPLLRRPALALVFLFAAQICLGALTILSARAVLPTTAHVALGAAVLASSLVLALRSIKLTGFAHRAAEPASVGRVAVAPREGARA
ncbi:MAG TPA: COX15/CtaA family protein [Candidatus Binataceae bacterium]